MAISTVVEGALVACSVRPYDFTDEAGKQVRGETRTLFVVESFDSPPQEIKVKDGELFHRLVTEGPGSSVRLHCEVFARNNRTSLQLVQALGKKAA